MSRLLPALFALLTFASAGVFAQSRTAKGGDDRNGAYGAVANWWKPAPEHDATWTWGEVSGLAADTPDRIIVAIWGDRNRQNQPRPDATNYLVVVNRNGDIVERWQQWDSILNRPHQVYISPYDPERHVWIVERGGGRGVPMSILKFTNDGKQLVMKLGDGGDPRNREEARANRKPGPFDFGDPACLAFFPDGSFLLADGYWNSRIVKYNAKGEYVMEWGELGKGPGQFDLVHGVAIDRNRRVYVADRTNNRIQVFTEQGKFIEEWPDITDPVGVYIDESDAVWVVSAALNRILKYNRDGVLQYHWGAYGGTRGGFVGGLSRPHQIDVDQQGNVYIASWDGGWVTKYVPKPSAEPSKLIGRKLVISRSSQRDAAVPAVKPSPRAVQLCAGHVTGTPGAHIVWTVYYSSDPQEKVVEHYLGVLGSQNHSKEKSEDVWRFPVDQPVTVLSVSPAEQKLLLNDCQSPPARARTVLMISTMARP